MANTNCLQGMQCPECESEGPFRIVAEATFEVCDDGTEPIGDVEWDDDAHCQCAMCSHSGTVADFSLDRVPAYYKTQITLTLSVRHVNDAKYGVVTDAILAGLKRGDIISKLEQAIKDTGFMYIEVPPDGVVISGIQIEGEKRNE